MEDKIKAKGLLVTAAPSFGIFPEEEEPSSFNEEDWCKLLWKYDNKKIEFELTIREIDP